MVISGWLLELTNLDVRYDSVWIATLLLAATLLALRLKSKMSGPLGLRDAWIPPLCLSLGQFETVVSTPNASHSVLPLALILLAANLWLSPRPAIRYLAGAAIAFNLTFTGFGLFAGAVIAALLAAGVVRHAWRREYRLTWLAAAGLAVVVLSWVLFSKQDILQTAVEGFRFPWTPWTDYLRFVALMLNLPTWHTGASAPHYRMGGVLALVMVAAAARIARIWMKRRPSLNDDVLVLLMGSSLLFITMTAVGRISLGVTGGEASRYLSLMFPGWLAVYLAAGSSRLARPVAVVCVWLLAIAPYTAMAGRPLTEWPGTFGLSDEPLDVMKRHGAGKAAWADVFLATGSWEAAQGAVQQPIYPNPAATLLMTSCAFCGSANCRSSPANPSVAITCPGSRTRLSEARGRPEEGWRGGVGGNIRLLHPRTIERCRRALMDEALIVPTVIRNLDLSAVRERLVHKKGWTGAHADRLIEEYREYLALVYFHPGEELVPPTQEIDDVWHEHILDTQRYSDDCRVVFGRFIHHVPGLDHGTDRHTEGLHRTRRHWWQRFGRDRRHALSFQRNESGGFDTVTLGSSCTSSHAAGTGAFELLRRVVLRRPQRRRGWGSGLRRPFLRRRRE